MYGYKGRCSANVCPAGQDLSKVSEFFNSFIFKMLPHQYSVVGMSLYCFTLLNTIMVGSLIFKRLCNESGVHMRLNFVRQNLRYFVSFKGIPFTYTDIPSPCCQQQTEKVLPHDEMEECKVAFECTPPILESIFRNGGVRQWILLIVGGHALQSLFTWHTRGFTMSSSNVYLIKF